MAEIEQRPKLVSAHPQIPFWLKNCLTKLNSTFCTFALCYSDIPNCVADTKKAVRLLSQFVSKYFTLFHITTSSFFFINQKAHLLLLLMNWYILLTHLSKHQNFRTDLRFRWVLFKIKIFVGNHEKNGPRGKNYFWLNWNFILYMKI